MMNGKPFEPDWTVSPGEMLSEVLDEHGLSFYDPQGHAALEALFGENLEAVHGILTDRVPVTAEIAAELGRVLDGPPARFWLNAEALYQADLIRLGRAVRVCARCRRLLTDEDEAGWFYRHPVEVSGAAGASICVHSCDGLPHDVFVRDRALMAALERARQCPCC